MVAMATDLQAHSDKPPPTKPDLQATVAQVVDDVAKDAAFSASLVDEKVRVQSLINNLVSNVANPPSTPPSDSVPVGDHRPRTIDSLPLSWTQALDAVTLSVSVPAATRKNHVAVSFTPGSVKVRVRDENDATVVQFDKPILAAVDVDGCMWALEGVGEHRRLTIELEKAQAQWWSKLFMEDDPADYNLVDVEQDDVVDTSVNDTTHTTVVTDIEDTDADQTEEVDNERANSTEGETSVQDGVEAVVNEVVDAAVASLSDSSEDEVAKSTNEPQKVLTRADLPRIVSQYRTAVERGGPGAADAALQLATFYHHGIGVEQNDVESARLYKFALENGALDASAAFQLGLIYNQGAPGLEADATEAVRWWRVAASLGNSVAMFNLGVMAMNGSGCEMDPIMATRWFQQAQALNSQLTPPQFSRTQLEERMVIAARLKKERAKQLMSPEEKQRRKEEALRKVRLVCYSTAAVVGVTITAVAIRHWWRNQL